MKIISMNLTSPFKENFRGTTVLPYHLLKGKSKAHADYADDLISQYLVRADDAVGTDGLITLPHTSPSSRGDRECLSFRGNQGGLFQEPEGGPVPHLINHH